MTIIETNEKKKGSNVGANNKRKGSNAERYYVNLFKEMGYDKCVTARYGSRIHDDAGIDLINIPFNVQIKAGKQKGLNPVSTLIDIKGRIERMFPKENREHDYPTILIHKKEVGKGKKRTEFDEVVIMTFSDFKKLIKKEKVENVNHWDKGTDTTV